MKLNLNKNILIVTSGFYPNPGGASHVMTLFAKGLANAGNIWFFASDTFPSFGRKKLYGHTVYYFFNRFYKISGKLERFFSKIQVPLSIKILRKIIKMNEIDIVIGVYPILPMFLSAFKASNDCGTAFIPFFHDAIPSTHLKLEKLVVSYSDYIFTINEAFKDYYQKKYPRKRIEVINFPVDPDDLNYIKTCQRVRRNVHKVVVWSGNIHGGNYNSLKRVFDAVKIINDKGDLFVQIKALTSNNLVRMKDGSSTIIKFYVKSRKNYLEELCRSDVGIVTMDWPDEAEYDVFELENALPTKIFDYMVAKIPVLVHSPRKYYLSKFTEANNLGLIVDRRDIEKIAEKMESLLSKDYTIHHSNLEEFLLYNVVERFISILNSV